MINKCECGSETSFVRKHEQLPDYSWVRCEKGHEFAQYDKLYSADKLAGTLMNAFKATHYLPVEGGWICENGAGWARAHEAVRVLAEVGGVDFDVVKHIFRDFFN